MSTTGLPLRSAAVGFFVAMAVLASPCVLAQTAVREPTSKDVTRALKNDGTSGSVNTALVSGQEAPDRSSSTQAPPGGAPRRMLRITAQLERRLQLVRRWTRFSREFNPTWYDDPAVRGVVLLLTSRVRDAGGNILPMAPRQPVCWCARGECTSLRTLSAQGECGRLGTPGDGIWDAHVSGSEWKVLKYGDAFVAANMELPPTAKTVELSILTNRCGDGVSFMFPITSSQTDAHPGAPVPFYLSFSPRGSRDFTATVEMRLLADGQGLFDVEVASVTMDDRDVDTKAATEKCIREHGGARCGFVSLEPDLDGLVAGVAATDAARCR